MTKLELKAAVYDLISALEQRQLEISEIKRRISALNAEIAKPEEKTNGAN